MGRQMLFIIGITRFVEDSQKSYGPSVHLPTCYERQSAMRDSHSLLCSPKDNFEKLKSAYC